MHVLVTGGAGYVGSQVAAHLLADGLRVTVYDRLLYGAEALLAFRHNERFSLIKGDVRDSASLRAALAGVDAVIHLAAVVGEDACNVDRTASWSTNVDGTKSVMNAVAEAGIKRLIFASTCSNYGVAAPGELATETAQLNPLSDYAKAKVECEKVMLSRNDLPCATVLRLGTICGLSARMRFDLLVSEIARNAALGVPIDVFAPDAWRPFLHVKDAARAFRLLLDTPAEKIAHKVFNVVGENIQKRGLVEISKRHFPQGDIKITDKKPDLRDYRVDGGLVAKELGFKPELTVEDAFKETAAAVAAGMFRDPHWKGHSAIPLDGKID
ncbi:MAG TPA: NAD(P)-dependent oxidoreductase [Reyranella sp.]|jgi:nucleoside-diphosphate-sugar epimerase|nr:NAD(P)-dependent oxidoreductase [Reyranella sp.]